MKYRALIILPALLWSMTAGAQALTGSSLNLNTPYNSLCPNNANSLVILNQQPAYGLSPSCPGLSTFDIVDIKRRSYDVGGVPLGAAIPVFSINPTGRVVINNSLRIGTLAATGAYANYKLSVDGDMIAKRCVIQVTSWADYVFAPGYNLSPLADVEAFIARNKHLPDVPSEAEVKEKGIEMGEMNAILLKKVEELTLYLIQLKKDSEAMQEQNRTMRAELDALKASR